MSTVVSHIIRRIIMGYGNKSLNDWRDDAVRIAHEHGFKDASVGEDMALIHSEVSEALEAYRAGMSISENRYELAVVVDGHSVTETFPTPRAAREHPSKVNPLDEPKPVGVPSEIADVIIRCLHFAGKHNIDIEQAVREKMAFNESRPVRHGGKKL